MVDTKEGKLVALVDAGTTPHPAAAPTSSIRSSARSGQPATSASEMISLIGTDPEKHPQQAWKVVQELKGQGGGSLFIKTHPKSQATCGSTRR